MIETIKRKKIGYFSPIEFEEGVFVINHVEGCSHGCKYPCYAQLIKRKDYETWCKPKLIENTLELLDKEIPKYKDKIKRVHLCFSTDPFMYNQPEVTEMTLEIIRKLFLSEIPYKTLTKGFMPCEELMNFEEINRKYKCLYRENHYGISLVSLNEDFRLEYEPFAAPYEHRIIALEYLSEHNCYTYVYMEPFSPEITSFEEFKIMLDKISFVKKIYFGSWQYNKRYSNKTEFQKYIEYITRFCGERSIELKIKKEVKI